MIKLAIYLLVLLALSVTDIILMQKENLKKEVIPYAVIAAAAGAAAVMLFTGFQGSLMRAAAKLLGISR